MQDATPYEGARLLGAFRACLLGQRPVRGVSLTAFPIELPICWCCGGRQIQTLLDESIHKLELQIVAEVHSDYLVEATWNGGFVRIVIPARHCFVHL